MYEDSNFPRQINNKFSEKIYVKEKSVYLNFSRQSGFTNLVKDAFSGIYS